MPRDTFDDLSKLEFYRRQANHYRELIKDKDKNNLDSEFQLKTEFNPRMARVKWNLNIKQCHINIKKMH